MEPRPLQHNTVNWSTIHQNTPEGTLQRRRRTLNLGGSRRKPHQGECPFFSTTRINRDHKTHTPCHSATRPPLSKMYIRSHLISALKLPRALYPPEPGTQALTQRVSSLTFLATSWPSTAHPLPPAARVKHSNPWTLTSQLCDWDANAMDPVYSPTKTTWLSSRCS